MRVLLNWIHVASIEGAPLVGGLPIHLNALPVVPLADARLLGYLKWVLQCWLPGLIGTLAASAQAVGPCTTDSWHPPIVPG